MNARISGGLAALAAGLWMPVAAAGDCGSLDALEWLLGEWEAITPRSIVQESWRRVGPETFEGRGIQRAKEGGTVRATEDLRLLRMQGSVYYLAKVEENPMPVPFRLSACDGGSFVFENPAHDFPRRLEYRQESAERLVVRVGDGGERGFTLDFERRPATPGTAAVLAAEDARFAAMVAADRAAMEPAFAAALRYVHSTGAVQDRRELIDSIASGRVRYRAVAPSGREVVLFGDDTALVRGAAQVEVAAGDASQAMQIRYLAIYARDGKHWRLHDWQSLRLP